MIKRAILAGILLASSATAQGPDDSFGADDLARLAEVGEPAFSPDGHKLAYAVTVTKSEADKKQSDLWWATWDGGSPRPLTNTPDFSESLPQWSKDGR